MSVPGDFKSQLLDLTVILTGLVAERLAHWSRDSDPSHRRRILDMIENNLPDVIMNTIAKTPSLHSASGVAYLEENLESYTDDFAKKLIGKI